MIWAAFSNCTITLPVADVVCSSCRYQAIRNYFKEQEAEQAKIPQKTKHVKMKGSLPKKSKKGL